MPHFWNGRFHKKNDAQVHQGALTNISYESMSIQIKEILGLSLLPVSRLWRNFGRSYLHWQEVHTSWFLRLNFFQYILNPNRPKPYLDYWIETLTYSVNVDVEIKIIWFIVASVRHHMKIIDSYTLHACSVIWRQKLILHGRETEDLKSKSSFRNNWFPIFGVVAI